LRFGFVFVEDAPFDDAVHTKQLLERIGPIRETHYGGFYDFVPDMAKADTAYSTMALPAHTDTTYFTDPAGLQAFHLLSHTPSPDAPEATGGESLLVDGFRAAEILRVENKPDFQELARIGLPWHASGNKGIAITTERLHPVLRLENIGNINSPIEKIRWNNDDRGGKCFQ
jgi:alpha-ketoglutarate-dependent taurine dioxygenase